ncbi:MAG: molybdopterin-guanine dinucleotide biosynthesis protein B [Proteobacteria bacterium]|nr:MAG: molybdopterin-guanine dinucleotide biosynthesis protein B [Pseudomonadota bacterium]QKK12386.1 MAG: molybdopterin-guanine dinucleotide biosynthesis protein B [Pseudomonadota bacterium]
MLTKPILGIAAYSGTGKTTLLRQVIPLLGQRGIRVGMIKHAHHKLEIDTPGKDSYELRKSGADQVLVASNRMWALMVDTPGQDEPQLDELVRKLDQERIDLILVEGFKQGRFPKIELHRPSVNKPLIFPKDDTIIAIACDAELSTATDLPLLDINSPQQIADFICSYVETAGSVTASMP